MDYEHMSNMIIEVVVKLSSEYPVGDVEAGSTDTLELLPKVCCTLDLQYKAAFAGEDARIEERRLEVGADARKACGELAARHSIQMRILVDFFQCFRELSSTFWKGGV